MFRSMSVLKSSAIAISLGLLFLVVFGIKALFDPMFDRTSDPSVFSQQSGFPIPAQAQILDAGMVNTFGIYPLHKAFAVFILPRGDLGAFLKEPGIKSYNPPNAKLGKQSITDAPSSLGFSSKAWRPADVTQFRAYHFSGQAGNVLVDLTGTTNYKVYVEFE
ncbi:MAG: hypothetical protein ACRYFS_00225 [Janthinobacterium lividum]